jgi:hypothetical protein
MMGVRVREEMESMGVTATTRLPAGWYPDPDGGDHRRWWDGQEWTQYTAEFQRPTSVEELAIERADSVSSKKNAKVKAPRRLRRVETQAVATAAESTAAEEPSAPGRSTAVRLGRWLAGAVHFAPSLKKRRRAHRSTR